MATIPGAGVDAQLAGASTPHLMGDLIDPPHDGPGGDTRGRVGIVKGAAIRPSDRDVARRCAFGDKFGDMLETRASWQ